ncbi:porin [Paraburkholderia agricolaris]|uniref:Porin n=1 Tax=Paraburkholderia agricolaris TaxID=2152888 RepID=A0ABW8ZMM6_9BURK
MKKWSNASGTESDAFAERGKRQIKGRKALRRTRNVSLLGFLALCTAPGVANAQSMVTIYGVVDVAIAKYDGKNTVTEGNGSTSRLGFIGSEDLGNGLKAIFQLETQINPNNGTQYNPTSFWSGRSTVGLEGGFGRVTVGREVNPSHYVESSIDPFTQDGMAGGYGARGGISQANGAPGAIDTVRTNNSINYYVSGAGLTFRAQTAVQDGVNTYSNRPLSASLIYKNGPFQIGASYLNPSLPNDHWSYIGTVYDLNFVKLSAGFGTGSNTFKQSIKNMMVGANIPLGATSGIRSTFSLTRSEGTTIQAKTALGYYYSLSKQTVVYTDAVYDSKAGAYTYTTKGWTATGQTLGKLGYEMGLKHLF